MISYTSVILIYFLYIIQYALHAYGTWFFCIPRKESQKQSNFVYFQKNGSRITPKRDYNLYIYIYVYMSLCRFSLIPSW